MTGNNVIVNPSIKQIWKFVKIDFFFKIVYIKFFINRKAKYKNIEIKNINPIIPVSDNNCR